MRRHLGIVVLLVVYVTLACVYNAVNPIFEAPDEIWHYLFVRSLASGQGLPTLGDDHSQLFSQQEAVQPPLYYVVGALLTAAAPRGDVTALAAYNPSGSVGDPTTEGNKNHFIHGPSQQFPWHGEVFTVHLARFGSTLWGAATVLLTYFIGVSIGLPVTLALAGAATVGLTPQFLFMSSAVDNDVAVAATGALLLLLAVHQIQQPLGLRRSVGLGIVTGLAILAKPLAGGGGAVVVLAIAIAAWRCRSPIQKVITHSFVAAGAALLTCGWWFVRNLSLYHALVPLDLFVNRHQMQLTQSQFREIVAGLPGLVMSYWELFGWFSIRAPAINYRYFYALMVLAGLGWLSWAVRYVANRARRSAGVPPWDWFGVGLAAALATTTLLALFAWLTIVLAFQGRLAFGGISAFALLLVVGWAGLVPRRVAAPVALALGLSLVVPASLAPWTVLEPAYAAPPIVDPRSIVPSRRLDVQIGDDIRLRGVDLTPPPNQLHPGDELRVTLYLEGTQPMATNYTLFLQILDWQDRPLVKLDSYPGQGNLPTSFWPVGKVIVDQYRLRIPNNAPTPSVGDLIVGMYSRPTLARLAITQNGRPVESKSLSLGPLVFRSSHPVSSPESGVVFGDKIVITGTHLDHHSLAPGSSLDGTIDYAAIAPIGRDYTVFVHLVGPKGLIAQRDGPPAGGAFPTHVWQPADRASYSFRITVPPETPPGDYSLVSGWYDPRTGGRLSTPNGDSVVLGIVHVVSGGGAP